MTQVKNFFYGGAIALLATPILVSAQFDVKAGGKTKLPTGGTGGTVLSIMTNIMLWLLALIGIFGVIAFVISGIMYLTSAGDEDQAGKAKKAMIYAVIGVIVALLGLIVLQAANSFLSGKSNF